jgi:hypothetical protein
VTNERKTSSVHSDAFNKASTVVVRMRLENKCKAQDFSDYLAWVQKSIDPSNNYIHTLQESVESRKRDRERKKQIGLISLIELPLDT